ncbi:MAG: hypothetical protein JWR38_2855 [Mucilaginibacter sp.]|nr:hypothetical protein [Mucilaginibacter sp.]
MSLLQQYRKGNKLKLNIKSTVNNSLITKIVHDYKELLQQRNKEGMSFVEEAKELEITFIENASQEDANEAFDLLFLSYLALLKTDFPNITIKLYYPFFDEKKDRNNYFFKLNQHRLHFFITGRREVFQLYKNNIEYKARRIFQSVSYIPPLPVDAVTLDTLFAKKQTHNDYLSLINLTINGTGNNFFDISDREGVLSKMQQLFKEKKDPLQSWNSSDLSGLYFLKALYDLYVLRHYINLHYGLSSDYQIGQTIVSSKDDTESTVTFRKEIANVLIETSAFYFSDVEAYFFSLIISNSDLFKIPLSREEMHAKVSPFFSGIELEQLAIDTKFLRSKYINIYKENLRRIIGYVKDISYGLEELAKNIVDHTISRHGIITARIYKYKPIVSLKTVDDEWLNKFNSNHKFLDINLIDSGFVSIKKTYKENLLKEKEYFTGADTGESTKALMVAEYNDDIGQIENFQLSDFLNFNSVKLYHQINRTKARLGLLIFAQTILYEKEAFVSLSSNDLYTNDLSGSNLFVKNGDIVFQKMEKMMPLGTHYNFIIPMNEVLEMNQKSEDTSYKETSISSSVFMELHNYGFEYSSRKRLFRVVFESSKISTDKYAKLDELKAQIGQQFHNGIIVINAKDLVHILSNSSDWIRFLANMQFSSDFFKDIIVCGLPSTVYVEIINILKLFDKISSQTVGFWKKDRFILFYIPVEHNGSIFWFNSLLTAARYRQFVKMNDEIGLYHLNFNSVVDQEVPVGVETNDLEVSDSQLFSKSKKLLNFELLIENESKMSLFEDTMTSLINIPIDNDIHED